MSEGFDLNMTPEQAEAYSTGCREARYVEALGEMEAALQQWDDLDHLIEQGGAVDLDEALCGRDEAYQRTLLYAGVAAAYRPAVDPVALAREIKAALREVECWLTREEKRGETLVQGWARREAARRDRVDPGWYLRTSDQWGPELVAEASRRRTAEGGESR